VESAKDIVPQAVRSQFACSHLSRSSRQVSGAAPAFQAEMATMIGTLNTMVTAIVPINNAPAAPK
jgi:hypothetical protein